MQVTPGKDQGVSKHNQADKAFRPQCKPETCEREGGRKEGWVEGASGCSAALSKSPTQKLRVEESHVGQKWPDPSNTAVPSYG